MRRRSKRPTREMVAAMTGQPTPNAATSLTDVLYERDVARTAARVAKEEQERLQNLLDLAQQAIDAECERAERAEKANDDMAMAIRQLAYRLRKHDQSSDTAARAMALLERLGLQGSPLRDSDQARLTAEGKNNG
jgi:hypothetical protein